MESNETGKRRRERADAEAPAKQGQEQAAPVEHDQDSEPPRTARPPGQDAVDAEWGRQEGC